MRRDEQAAVAAAAAMFASEEEEAAEETVAQQETEEVAEQGTETTEAETTPEVEEEEEENLFPSWEIQLPEELVEEMESPTDEETQEELEEEEGYYELDENGRQLLARARAAERKAEHYEKLRIQEARKSWTQEAQKYFPLSAHVVDSIQADSRKSFLRQAKAAHEAVVPYVKEITDKARETIEAEKGKAVATARQEAEKAWGKVPATSEQPTEGVVAQERLARNRAKGDLAGTIREMMWPKKGS